MILLLGYRLIGKRLAVIRSIYAQKTKLKSIHDFTHIKLSYGPSGIITLEGHGSSGL